MDRTKLGITTALLSTAIFLSGMMSTVALVLMVGYVLIAEEDLWLKKNAVRALFIVILFAGLSFAIDLIPSVIGVIVSALGSIGVVINLSIITSLFHDIDRIIGIIKVIILLICAYQSFMCKDPAFKFVDGIVNKHLKA